jgi:hypothetical protein
VVVLVRLADEAIIMNSLVFSLDLQDARVDQQLTTDVPAPFKIEQTKLSYGLHKMNKELIAYYTDK